MTTDSSKTIFRSARAFLSGTLLSRVTGLLRDVAMAFSFGTTPSIAALMIAFRFSHLFRRLLGEGALQTAFIPKFEEIRKDEENEALKFFCDLTVTLSLFLILLIILIISGICIAYSYSSDPSVKEILKLTAILMPSLLFICLYGLNSGLLQCHRKYFLAGVSPVAFNILWITGALTLAGLSSEDAVTPLAGFIVLACAAQWLMTLPSTLSILKNQGSFPNIKHLLTPQLKAMLLPLLMSIGGVAATQVNSAIDPLFARYADKAGPAYLWYAIRMELFPLSLFGVALANALLPPLSRAAKKGESGLFSHFLNLSLSRSMLFMIPMVGAYFIAGDSCINLVFGHGDFGNNSVIATTTCLWGYAFGLVPAAMVLILAPAFYALNDYRTPMLTTLVAVLINLSLNSYFVLSLGMGASAVALATSISSWINCTILATLLYQKLQLNTLGSTALRTSFATATGMLLVVFLDQEFFNGNGLLMVLQGKEPLLSHHFGEQLLKFLAEAALFAIPITICWVYELLYLQPGAKKKRSNEQVPYN